MFLHFSYPLKIAILAKRGMNLDALHFRAISKVFFEGLISRLLTRARQATGFVGYLFAPLLVAGHVFLEAKKQHEPKRNKP